MPRKILALSFAVFIIMLAMAPLAIAAEEISSAQYKYYGYVVLGCIGGLSIAAVGGGWAMSSAVKSAMTGMARNPGAAEKMTIPLIIGLALMEALVIYTFVIALILPTPASYTWIVDTIPPTGFVSINSGAAYTNTTSVTLTLSYLDLGSEYLQMQFSNDNTNWSTAETFATSKTWTLTSGDGTKTVYAKLKDNAGNWTTTTINDTIILDTISPSDGFSKSQTDIGIEGIEREDGGTDSNNLDSSTGKPKVDIRYIFKIVFKDSSGNQPQYVRLYMTQRNNPTTGNFYTVDLTCTGSWASGATCSYSTLLGPAAKHKYYFEAKLANGTIVRYLTTGEIDGPVVELLNGYNMVGVPRDLSGANMDGAAAFSRTPTYRWGSNGPKN